MRYLIIILLLLTGCGAEVIKEIPQVIIKEAVTKQAIVEKPDVITENVSTEPGEPDVQIIGQTEELNIDSFLYQLQEASFIRIKESDFDLLIIDIDDSGFTNTQIKELQDQGKLVVSYLSIGEAEDYRNYWEPTWRKGNPDFIIDDNPDWHGNYKVEFWDRSWHNIILNQVDRIIEKGYNGAYLDIIDAYEYFEGTENKMIDFVVKISEHAKRMDSDFLIIPQNGLGLVNSNRYLEAIDGVGAEDTFYDDNDLQDIDETAKALTYLEKVLKNGKFVLLTDYPEDKHKKCDFYRNADSRGYAAYAARRELDRITVVDCD